MAVFCWHQDSDTYSGDWGEWGDCDSGSQVAGYYICVGDDPGTCSGTYSSPTALGCNSKTECQAVVPGLDFEQVPNLSLTTGVPSGGGGGSSTGIPELSSADIALIGGKVLLIFALVFSIRIVYGVIMNRR